MLWRGRLASLFISLAARGTGLLFGQVLHRKKGPIELIEIFLNRFDEPGRREPPTVASNEAAGSVSQGTSL